MFSQRGLCRATRASVYLMYTNGSFNNRLFFDLIEEALHTPGKRGVHAKRGIADLAKRQLELCEKLHRQFRRHVMKMCKLDEAWIPEPEFTKAKADNASEMARIWKEIREAKRDEKAALEGLSSEAVDKVFITHLSRIAREMTDDQRRAMLAQWFGGEAALKLIPVKEVTQ